MKFTVIIPTRERYDTLQYTLKTCVEQDYDDLTILVSDNCSEDATLDVVKAFSDPRIKYVNPGKRLGMAMHWEYALTHVGGGYFTYLGDDDGLLPNAVKEVAGIIGEIKVPVVTWLKVEYHWPLHPIRSDYLRIPMRNNLVLTSAKKVLRDMVNGWVGYTRGPSVYSSFVDYEVAERIQERSGSFFNSVTPDVYSSFAIPSSIEKFLYSTRPFSVNGASEHSNGCAWGMASSWTGKGPNPAKKFLEEVDIPIHPQMGILPGSMYAALTEALLQANDHCYDGALKVNLKKEIAKIVREYSLKEPELYSIGMRHLDELAARLDIQKFMQKYKRRFLNRPSPSRKVETGLDDRGMLILDASQFDVTNVHEAALLVHRLLGDYSMPSKASSYSHYDRYFTYLHRVLGRWVKQ